MLLKPSRGSAVTPSATRSDRESAVNTAFESVDGGRLKIAVSDVPEYST